MLTLIYQWNGKTFQAAASRSASLPPPAVCAIPAHRRTCCPPAAASAAQCTVPFRHSYSRTAAFPATASHVKATCARSDDDQNNNAPRSVRSVPVHHKHRFPGNMPDIPEAMQGITITDFRKHLCPGAVLYPRADLQNTALSLPAPSGAGLSAAR